MATFGPVTIAANADNGFQDTGFWTPGFVNAGDNTGDNNPGWRWLNVTVPQGATITSALLHIRARNAVVGTITNVHMKTRGHKGDAPAFGDGTFEPPNVNWTTTTAGIDWDPTVWTVDAYYDIDFTTVVQEIVSDGSWASGHDLALALIDDGSTSGNYMRMYAQADGDTAANTITIVYADAGVAIAIPSGVLALVGLMYTAVAQWVVDARIVIRKS